MMSTTVKQAGTPRTITLTNGTSFTFNSNIPTTDEQIPVIDVSRMYSNDVEQRKVLAEEIREAAHSIGFLSIVNHVSGDSHGLMTCLKLTVSTTGSRHELGSERARPSQSLLFPTNREEDGGVH